MLSSKYHELFTTGPNVYKRPKVLVAAVYFGEFIRCFPFFYNRDKKR